jgi:biotin operon repressor
LPEDETVPKTSSRVLTLLSLLQTKRDWPGVMLAERLEVSARTVRRDVERLRELGYRIRSTKGPDGGYRLEDGNELPPLLFDDDQAVAITVALGRRWPLPYSPMCRPQSAPERSCDSITHESVTMPLTARMLRPGASSPTTWSR